MPTTVIKRALHHVKRLRAEQARYDAEVEEYHRQGFRAHYCLHGADRWVDYDNICGPCEDGYGRYEGQVLYDLALDIARDEERTFRARAERVFAFVEADVPDSLRTALIEWATAPLTD